MASSAPPTTPTDEPGRLRQAELALARMQGEIGENFRERVAALEKGQESLATKADVAALEKGQESLATKADLERAKVWGLTSLVAAGTSVLILLLRLVSWIWPAPGAGGG